jgi:hypothetical protein
VTCTANSLNSVQYKNVATTASFSLIQPEIIIDPTEKFNNVVYGTNFEISLQLQPAVQTGSVFVQCAINEFDTLASWNKFTSNTLCPNAVNGE